MKVAYLTSVYPTVSHTFVRRELKEVERQLGTVERFSIRKSPHAIVDHDDHEEERRTFRVLSQPLGRWVVALLRHGVRAPRSALRGFAKCVHLARDGHTGWFRHFAYFLEAILLLDEMSKRGIEHLHVHFGTNPTAVARIMRAMGGPPYSFTVHGPDEFDAPISFALAGKLEDASFVIAISHYCSAQLRRWTMPGDWDKIQLVRCGVSEDFFEQARPIDPGSRTLVCVGRLAPQKGQVLLLDAFAEALSRGAEAKLVLVGDGELREQLEARIRERQLSQHVRITGWCTADQVQRELLAARALVLPSFAEGLPVVIMEAFALGRPVLSTYVAGIPELVKTGENGWLVPAGSRDALTEALIEVLNAPASVLESMAARGREAVRRQHCVSKEAAKLASLLMRSRSTELSGRATESSAEAEHVMPPINSSPQPGSTRRSRASGLASAARALSRAARLPAVP